jgi:hypothetical protein
MVTLSKATCSLSATPKHLIFAAKIEIRDPTPGRHLSFHESAFPLDIPAILLS